MKIRIFKFGGASVKDANGIKNICKILSEHRKENIVIVVSAMDKTTNALEKITDAYFYKTDHLFQQVEDLKQFHFRICEELFGQQHSIYEQLEKDFKELSEILSHEPSENYDFDYDQIVSYGEFWATKIVSSYLQEQQINNTWIDIIDILKTDNTYREAKVDWEVSRSLMRKKIYPIFKETKEDTYKLVITQGFTGQTEGGWATTLGREGSDYTAAILAYCLDAKDVTIWKDVAGVMNADPKLFPDTVVLPKIDYKEAIELAYYGASIIHPKTIKPLENADLPLYVKCFLDPELPGTLVNNDDQIEFDTPIYIKKFDQVLISIAPLDFSFIVERNISQIFDRIAKYRIKVNMIQNSAISFSICVDNHPEKIEKLISKLKGSYKILYNGDLELITIRHYTDESIQKITEGRAVLLEQKTRSTARLVVK